uniref:F-box/kelch-repeat protein n=2 Tax=Noccaea caerulescens TaxID=107243 RepID=A0A1J3F3I0_NOCCA
MRTRRRTYTAATPPSLLPTVSGTKRRQVQSCSGSKKKKKSKCILSGLWDLKIPSDLVQEILSRLGLKASIHASLVCKAWCEAAVSVRKFKPRPWIVYRNDRTSPTSLPYILVDPWRSQSQTYKFDVSYMEEHAISYSRDGWLLVRAFGQYFYRALFVNPFTNKKVYLPNGPAFFDGYSLAFSAAPTSSNCVVISYNQIIRTGDVLIFSWRPGESKWTKHRFLGKAEDWRRWDKCVFSNGLFYCLSNCGHLGVFDPCEATWNVLPVKPLPAFNWEGNTPEIHRKPVLMTEHEGDIFVIYTPRDKSNRTKVFKLNLKQYVWQKKRDLGGLTVFASFPSSFIRAGLSAEERNRIYPPLTHGIHYSSSHLPPGSCVSSCVAWVEPPHNMA